MKYKIWWQVRKIDGKTLVVLSKPVFDKILKDMQKDPPKDEEHAYAITLESYGEELG